jgi:holo-[acyl-carrier protein] synthase
MVQGIGADLQDIGRTVRLLDRHGERMVDYVYTRQEWETGWRSPSPSVILTVMFSFKESVSKALGTGISDVRWTDIEVLPDSVSTSISLHGYALQTADRLEITDYYTSWKKVGSHVHTFVLAQSSSCEKGL